MKTMLAAAVMLVLTQAASAQPSITLVNDFDPEAVSADGRVVVGDRQGRAVYWTRQTGVVNLNPPSVPGAVSSVAVGVSSDGSVIVGNSLNQYGSHVGAWICMPQSSRVLSMPNMALTRATCVSQDGLTVGGIGVPAGGAYQSFVWTGADGFRLIPWGTNYQTWLHGLSANGLKGAGSGSSAIGTWATYWGSTYVWCQNLGPIEGRNGGFAFGISGDGSTIVGYIALGASGPAFVWSAADGMTVLGTANAVLNTVSYDGRIAAGTNLVWVKGAGAFTLNAYCLLHGLSGAGIGEIVGMSANGRVMAEKLGGSHASTIIIDLGSCGSADFNHDGDAATDADIEAFFRCLAGDCCPLCDSADFNYDGDAATDSDIEAFFRVLGGGSC
jgi:hypothetical protein